MVGDTIEDDVEGALAVGMQAVLLDREGRYPEYAGPARRPARAAGGARASSARRTVLYRGYRRPPRLPIGSFVRLKPLLNILAVAFALAVGGLVVRHFVIHGWPIHHANVWLVVLTGFIFLAAYGFKAWGWQRLFRRERRPAMVTLAAAGGAASVGGIALPGRFDELLRIAVVRRCRRPRASLGAVAFSLFLLGLIDSAALVPLASVAAGVIDVSGVGRAALIVVAVAGVAAAGARAGAAAARADPAASRASASSAGCRSTRRRRATRSRRGPPSPSRGRCAGSRSSCCSARSACGRASRSRSRSCAPRRPRPCCRSLRPARSRRRARAQRSSSPPGMHPDEAIAFGVAAQGLVIAAGAVCVAVMAAWHAEGRVRPAARPVAPPAARRGCEDCRRAQGEPARARVRRLARPRELPLARLPRSASSSARRRSAARCTSSARASGASRTTSTTGWRSGCSSSRARRRCAAPDGERELRRGDVVCFPPGPEGAHQVRGPGHGADALGAARARDDRVPGQRQGRRRARRGRSSAWPTPWTTGRASERGRQRVRRRAPRATRRIRPATARGWRASARRSARSSSAARCTTSIPGESVCPYHYEHPEEEWLLVLDGPPDAARPGRRARARGGRPRLLPGGPGRRAQGDEPLGRSRCGS